MFISKRCGCATEKTESGFDGRKLKKLSDDLSVIAVKSRLELLFLLNKKPHCVCDLMEHTKMSQSLISHHLADLDKRGYISNQRNGKYVDYHLTEKGKGAMRALELLIQ